MRKEMSCRYASARRILVCGGLLIMLLLLNACGRNTGTQSPEDRIKNLIEEKYGFSVQINEIEEKAGMQAFQERYYLGTVSIVDTGEEFCVLLGKKSGVLKDDYPKLVYDAGIREIIDHVLEEYPELTTASYEIHYDLSEGNWTQENQMTDYLENSDTEVGIHIVTESMSEEEARRIYSFARTLKKEGVHFTIEIKGDNNTLYISSNRHSELDEEGDVVKMLTD